MQLIRLPNVFTVLADVGAAFLLVAGGPTPVARLLLILLSGVSLYWAGMILNDVFDVEKDRAERSSRPLASGAISVRAASMAGWGLLLFGAMVAAASGYVPSPTSGTTWLPALIGIALSAMIVAYNGPLKQTPLAPAAMGGCRVLSFLLGASPMIMMTDGAFVMPRYLMAIAMGFGVYIMGITTIARDEATGGYRYNLRIGFVVMLVGAVILAMAPGLATLAERQAWRVVYNAPFVFLIAMIVLPVASRGMRLQRNPEPAQIGNTIRAGIMTIIPLSASFAFLGAGPMNGLAIFALVVPAILLATRLRVT